MFPLLQNRDILEISPTNSVLRGDIILFPSEKKEQWVAHRVIRIHDGKIWTRGDNNLALDDTILSINDIQGVITARWRKGKKTTIYRGGKGLAQYVVCKNHSRVRCATVKQIKRLSIPKPLLSLLEKALPTPRVVHFANHDQPRKMLYLGKIHIGIYSQNKQCWQIRFPYSIVYQL